MTTKELLAKAKVFGGWFVTAGGEIRTRKRTNGYFNACPVEAAVWRVDWRDETHIRIADAADGVIPFDPELRREMLSWCK